jgi:two-component system response regulator DevR
MTDDPCFLADDHEIVRRGLVDLLQAAGDIEVVGESGLAREATCRIPALRPDVAVLDAWLPDGDGPEVCRDVRAVDSSIKRALWQRGRAGRCRSGRHAS